jgi:hypothetical protein
VWYRAVKWSRTAGGQRHVLAPLGNRRRTSPRKGIAPKRPLR